jgi:hypothetical protein
MDLASERVGHAVEAFIQAQAGPRDAVTWPNIQQEVGRHFLSPDEEAALRDIVERQLTQDPHEAVNACPPLQGGCCCCDGVPSGQA